MNVITGMVAMGDPLYYEMAEISIPAFLRNNSSDLVLFTDRPQYFYSKLPAELLFRFTAKNYQEYLDFIHPKIVVGIDSKIERPRADFQYSDHLHLHTYIALALPMLQEYAEANKYDWCFKVDVDSYFVGDIIKRIEADTAGWTDKKDLYAVEQCHPEMRYFDECGVPTAGFIMWKTSSKFMSRYIEKFHNNEQETFWDRLGDGAYLRPCRLLWPGLHMVYPFSRNENFSKTDGERFLPAYFHLGGNNILKQIQLMDSWWNPKSKFKDLSTWK